MAKLDELRIRFESKLPARLGKIENMLFPTEAGLTNPCEPRDGDYEGARREAHKLAGTAGSFGFEEVARRAKQLEVLLGNDNPAQPSEVVTVVGALRDAIAKCRQLKRSRRPSVPRLALIGESEALSAVATLLEGQLADVHFVPATKRDLNRVGAFDVAVVDGSQGDAEAIIDMIRRSYGGPNTPVLCLTEDSTLVGSVAASSAGADLLLHLPLSAASLVDAVSSVVAKGRMQKAQVLAVDDDPDALDAIEAVLAPFGIETVKLSHPSQLFESLRNIDPAALILDFDMPNFSGVELCASLRSSRQHSFLPVLFLTNRDDQAAKRDAFDVGCDDFLLKGELDELGARVAARIKRSIGMRSAAETDALTGLSLRRMFLPAIDERISEALRRGTPLSLCLLDIDNFKKVNDIHGHVVGDRVLADIGNLINQRFRLHDLRCRWGGEEIVLAFPGNDAASAKAMMEELLSDFKGQIFQGKSGSFCSSFSAGVAELGSDGRTVDALVEAADKRMYRAKKQGRSRIVGPESGNDLSSKAVAGD